MTTVDDAVNRVTLLLSQVSGENVQLFAEDRIVDMLQSTYDTMFGKLWWPNRMRRESKTLDGSTGTVTANFTALTRFEDIKNIFITGNPHPLPEVPLHINPAVISGTRARCYEPITTTGKIFKCYPIASTDSLVVHYREKQAAFIDDTTAEIDFNVDLLVFHVVHDYLADDGTNPDATENYFNKANAKLKELTNLYGTRIVPFRRGVPTIPYDWFQYPI